MKKEKMHYSWVIAFVGFMIFAINFCIIFNCIGLYAKPVTQSLGILRQDYSMNNTVTSIVMMVMSILSGKIYSKFKLKTVLVFGAAACPLVYCSYAFATSKTDFLIISAFLGLAIACNGMIPVSMLMTNWFNKKRGFAIGIAFTGSGAGGIILNPVLAKCIEVFGWRQTFFIAALMMAVIILPLVVFFVKSTPQDKGCLPYGETAQETEKSEMLQGMLAKDALRSAKFWLYLPFPFFISVISCSIIQITIPFVEEIGYLSATAAIFGSLSMASLAVGKIFLGHMFDKKGVKFTTYSALLLFFVTLVFYSLGEIPVFLYAGVIISGYGSALSSVAYPVITQSLFGKKDYATIYGYISVFSSLGTAVGPVFASAIYDTMGKYSYAWVIFAVLCIVTAFIYFILNKVNKKEYI